MIFQIFQMKGRSRERSVVFVLQLILSIPLDNPVAGHPGEEAARMVSSIKSNRPRACNRRLQLGCRPFCRSASSGQRLLDLFSSFRIGRLHSVNQPVQTGIKELRQSDERNQGNGIAATFNVSDCFPVQSNQFSQTRLRHVGSHSRLADALADQPENLFVCHTLSWNRFAQILTPRIRSVNKPGVSWQSQTPRRVLNKFRQILASGAKFGLSKNFVEKV